MQPHFAHVGEALTDLATQKCRRLAFRHPPCVATGLRGCAHRALPDSASPKRR
jgi:hypothetical protein